jgi:uncharacterized membrane protein YhaH (DUF805 family)
MGFFDAVYSCMSKFATWEGRASRSEYWYFVLFHILSLLLAFAIGAAATEVIGNSVDFAAGLLILIVYIVLYIPQISVAVRRLHDTNHSGWFWWITIIPLLGLIIWIWLTCTKGDEFPNEYGEPPQLQ